jgi:hypothetical protein
VKTAKMQLSKILFIDDRVDEFRAVIGDFREAGIDVVELDGASELEAFLNKGESFDAVILDWSFDDTSAMAQLCLTKIKEVRFVPVLVWTEEPETFDNDLPDVKFPHSCIERISKLDINKDALVDYVNKWFQKSMVPSLGTQWRRSGAKSIEQSLYQLAELDENDVTKALRVLIQCGEGIGALDLDQAVEVLARLLQRELMSDSELSSYLREKLNAALGPDDVTSKSKSRVLRLHMYYAPTDDFVRTGDVVKVIQGERTSNALVATPSCDLARPRTEFLRLIVIDGPLKGGSSQRMDKCDLPLLGGAGPDFQDQEARFQEVISLKNLNLAEVVEAKKRKSVMRYTHKYKSMGGQEIIISRILRIDDPYRSDLLQKFAAHASRVGVPEF